MKKISKKKLRQRTRTQTYPKLEVGESAVRTDGQTCIRCGFTNRETPNNIREMNKAENIKKVPLEDLPRYPDTTAGS